MSKLEKKQQLPELDYVEQDAKSPVMTFVLKSEEHIDVLEKDVLAFIDDSRINVHMEIDEPYWTPSSCENEVITDAKVYLDNNFEYVTRLYFSSVLMIVQKEAISFMNGYMTSILKQGREIEKSDINKMMLHIHAEYGIYMEEG